MSFHFHIANLPQLQPDCLTLSPDYDPFPVFAAYMRKNPFQLQVKGMVVDGLQDKVKRFHRVPLNGILRHIGHKYQGYASVNLSKPLSRFHPGHQRQFNIHKYQIIICFIRVQHQNRISEMSDLKLQ